MSTERALSSQIRRLKFTLASTWALAWILGAALFAAVVIHLARDLHERELDTRLRTRAIALYGLAWFDEDRSFHNELLKYEEELLDGEDEAWVLQPGDPPVVHLRPLRPRLEVTDLAALAARVVENDEEVEREGLDARQVPYRLLALPTYAGTGNEPVAAILVVADARVTNRSWASFTTRTLLLMSLLGAGGVGVGLVLAGRSLRPLAATLAQRERFIAAAAHALRTPLSTLRAVCDSARGGDEPASAALERIAPRILHLGKLVDELLLFARLEAGAAELERGSLRLDLLVESCLPDDGSVELQAEECIVEADRRLLEVAVRALTENALQHGAASVPIRVRVRARALVVEDSGPGFPGAILELARGAFTLAPSSSGAGIGLATARMIAELHGGRLELANLPGGGARASLSLP